MSKKFFVILLLFVSLSLNAILGVSLFIAVKNIWQTQKNQELNTKVLSFTTFFIEKVIMQSQEVDFDTRLALETMVRNLGDQEIFDQWQRFTSARDSQEASSGAKKLLYLLIKKVSY